MFKYALIRIYLYFLFLFFFITFGLSALLLAPLYKMAFMRHAPYGSIRFFHLWAHMYKIAWRSVSKKSYRDLYSLKLTDPPKMHTDLSLVKVRDEWKGEEKNCDICKDICCAQLKCPLLCDDGRCLSYGSLFFSYFVCGLYPENQSQIDYYQCKKWEVRQQSN